jgi:hypothetical protein
MMKIKVDSHTLEEKQGEWKIVPANTTFEVYDLETESWSVDAFEMVEIETTTIRGVLLGQSPEGVKNGL